MTITEQELRTIRDRASLFGFLNKKLGWPVSGEDTFTYDGPSLTGAVAVRAAVSRIVPFAANDPFAIFLVEFETAFRRGDLRVVLRRIREEIRRNAKYAGRGLEELVFVCATEGYCGLRFAHFEARSGAQPTMRLFGFDREQADHTRTLREINLPALHMPAASLIDGPDWDAARAGWMSAWDVEKVTDGFYSEYKEIFARVEEGMIHGVKGDKRLFAQRLFNRLMFIQFLSKKGWMTFGGRRDYLAALFEAAAAAGESFYRDRLHWAFFGGLGIQAHDAEHRDLAELQERRGQVPYLNGGLFELDHEDDEYGKVCVDNEAFGLIINGLFARFNFTIHESTPLDIEVAVDPEMLGKVFEELVTGRHESGSYYTPRPIVAFMCREALKGYLGGFAELVDDHDVGGLTHAQARSLLQKLSEIKVVDPACGSGAYLLGMLQEIFALTRLLEIRADPATARADYQRKLSIIRKNLYGVDIDEFAVNIARLRLWLSLVVDFEGETPEPLPNLDFKVECGDSLSAPDPSGGPTADIFRQKDIDEFRIKKEQFADPYFKGDKAQLKREIADLRANIAAWAHPSQEVRGFDWRVEFAEVFERPEPVADLGGAMNFGGTLAEPRRPGGFDVVLANPPYVRQELIKELKPALARIYPEVYTGTADLYCYFYARALQLLAHGGMLVFISSNKWFRAGYGAKLRDRIAKTCSVISITDFGDLPVFQAAVAYPMVFVARKEPGGSAATYTQVPSLGPPYPDVRYVISRHGHRLPPEALQGGDWHLAAGCSASLSLRFATAGKPLREYASARIYRGITTGLNDAFVISGATRQRLISDDPRSADLIKPLALGRDVRRWHVENCDRWLIFARRGVRIDDYPAIKLYLSQWKAALTPKSSGADVGRKPGAYR
jgi:hypothetical protein